MAWTPNVAWPLTGPVVAELDQVMTKPVRVEPPLATGGVQERSTCRSPDVATTPVGGPGRRSGVANATEEAGPVPCWLIAETLKWYGKPLCRPMTE